MSVVVGSDGYLGSRLGTKLKSLGNVCLVARQGKAGTVAIGDLRNTMERQRLFDLIRGKTVFYCAVVGGRTAADADPEAAFALNAEIPALLAAHAKKIIYFSTDYVFSRPGRHTNCSIPDPTDTYSRSKATGERKILAASNNALIIRVSGLFDADGSRDNIFDNHPTIIAADNRRTRPTYVPDLIEATLALIKDDATGIFHVFGPSLLSVYEFWQIVSLRSNIIVKPKIDTNERFNVDVLPNAGIKIRSPAEVFAIPRFPSNNGFTSLIVSDCVGVLLSARVWHQTDPTFWMLVENNAEAALQKYGAHCIADAYVPNPAIWHQLREHPAGIWLILANNGPWVSFSIWAEKYGFFRIFDDVINSERDGLIKPSRAFKEYVHGIINGGTIKLIDDRAEIVESARKWGWTGVQTVREVSLSIDRWQLPSGTSMWSN